MKRHRNYARPSRTPTAQWWICPLCGRRFKTISRGPHRNAHIREVGVCQADRLPTGPDLPCPNTPGRLREDGLVACYTHTSLPAAPRTTE